LVKPGIIQVGPVKDQQIARLKAQVLDGLEVVSLAIGDQDAPGPQPGEDGVQLDGPFAGPKLGPGKDRGADVNGGGIDDLDGWGLLGLRRQLVREGGTAHLGEVQVIALAGLPIDAEHYVPETFASAPLTEEHGSQMRPIGEPPRVRTLPGMGVHQVVENRSRDEL
jgi:hypothetical protein